MRKILGGIGLFASLLAYATSTAQGLVVVDLPFVLETAGAQNLTLIEIERAIEVSRAESVESGNWWLPTLYAGANVHQLWGSAMNGDGRFFTDVDRQNFHAGVGLDFDIDFGRGTMEHRAQVLSERAVEVDAKAQKNQLLLMVVRDYYSLLVSQHKAQLLSNLIVQASEIADQMELQVENGIRVESEWLLAKAEINQLKMDLVDAQMDQADRSAMLVHSLNLDPGTKLACSDTTLLPVELSVFVPQERFELTATRYRLESFESNKEAVRKGLLLPELKVGAYTSTFGDVFSPQYPTSAINASLTWNLPLGSLLNGDESRRYGALVAREEARLDYLEARVSMEEQQAKDVVRMTREKMDLAEEAVSWAESALNQSLARQEAGTIRPFELAEAQEVFVSMAVAFLDAVADYNVAQFELKVALGEEL